MPGVSVSDTYDALLTTTLRNARKSIADNISTSNSFFYTLKKKGCFEEVDSLGYQAQEPLMYELGTAQPYAGYDVLSTTPSDGITSAFFDWRNLSIPVSISGDEEAKNSGENARINLLEAKIKQATLGIKESFNKYFLQGNGPNTATAVTTAYTHPTSGAVFIDPLPLLVKFSPSTTTVGGIDPATYTWWRNAVKDDDSSTFVGFLGFLRKLYNDAGKGPGGNPDLHVCGQGAFELYEKALAASHHNTSYAKADIPFDNILFRGSPVTWDQYVVDAKNGTAASVPVATSDTWYMLNTDFFRVKVHSKTNFSSTPFQKPINQDARVSQIMWRGAVTMNNRRKQAVMGSIDSTIAS